MLTTPVLDPQILRHLDHFDSITAKPAQVRKFINQKFGKDISYAQIAYELTKRKKRVCGQQNKFEIDEFISQFSQTNCKLETFRDKNKVVTRVIWVNEQEKCMDVLVVHKIQNMVFLGGIDSNACLLPYGLAMLTNTIIDDYLWIIKVFITRNENYLPPAVIMDYDENLANACETMFVGCKKIYSPWSIKQLENEGKLTNQAG